MAQATATIKIEKDNPSHRGVVRGAVNGQRYEFPVGKEVQVTEAQLNSLRDSRVEFTTVTPLAGEDADEGSSASSTIMGTAIRAEVPAGTGAAAAADQDPPELSQRTDEELTKDSQKVSQAQAETGTGTGTGGDGTAEAAAPTPTPSSAAATETKPKAAKGGTKPKTTAASKSAAKK